MSEGERECFNTNKSLGLQIQDLWTFENESFIIRIVEYPKRAGKLWSRKFIHWEGNEHFGTGKVPCVSWSFSHVSSAQRCKNTKANLGTRVLKTIDWNGFNVPSVSHLDSVGTIQSKLTKALFSSPPTGQGWEWRLTGKGNPEKVLPILPIMVWKTCWALPHVSSADNGRETGNVMCHYSTERSAWVLQGEVWVQTPTSVPCSKNTSVNCS